MSGLDKVLGDLQGGKGGGGGLGQVLSGLTGGGGLGGLAGLAGGGGGNLAGMLLPVVGSLLAGGGLQKLLSGLHANGLGEQADSWVGTGENKPITGDQVKQVLGDEQVGQVAQQLGVSHDEAAQTLATVLPQVVDHASPDGQLRPPEELEQAFGQLQSAPVSQ